MIRPAKQARDKGHRQRLPVGRTEWSLEMSKLLDHQRRTPNAQRPMPNSESELMFSYTGTQNALRGAMVDRPLRGRCQKWRRSRNSISNALGARVPPSVL
jgi:hypothetical protein